MDQRKFSIDARWVVIAAALVLAWQGSRFLRRLIRISFVLFCVWFWTHGGLRWLAHLH